MNKKNGLRVSDNPLLVAEWNFARNGSQTPEMYTFGSSKKVWWICAQKHEWEAMISNRARLGRGCPYCAGKKAVKGFNDLESLYPLIAAEWDYEKNFPQCPSEITAHSSKKYWWLCSRKHSWQSSVNNRAKGNNCPYCGHQRLLLGFNDLSTLNPSLAAQWNTSRNGNLSPQDFFPQSNTNVWWRCPDCGHEWYAKISNRANGTGCPKCSCDYKVSESEQIIFFYVKRHFPDAIQTYRATWLKKREIDIYIPSLKLAIEYDGEVWHKDTEKDLTKTKLLNRHGIEMIRLREENTPVLNDGSYQITVPSKSYHTTRLSEPIHSLFQHINDKYNLSIDLQLDLSNDLNAILALSYSQKNDRSLASLHPKIAAEWDYEKNSGLTPNQIFSQSNKVVWWTCSLGHSWPSSVSNRLNRGCPYCANKKILVGFNDLSTTNPNLSAEWDYEKNFPLLPSMVTKGSSKRIWWRCQQCSTGWRTSVANRSYGTGCPKCANKKKTGRSPNRNTHE